MERVEEKVADGRVLGLVGAVPPTAESWTAARAGRRKRERRRERSLSPLLSNIYLNPLDQAMAAAGIEMVRYADDFVILCRGASGKPSRPWSRCGSGPSKPD